MTVLREAAAVGYKPNSVRRRPRHFGLGLQGDNHSSSPAIAGGIKQPTRKLRTGRPGNASLFGLAPCGVLPATRVATSAVRSYRTFSPLLAFAPYGAPAERYIFCATFLQVALTGRYPAHCPAEFGLSSPRLGRAAIIWPTAAVDRLFPFSLVPFIRPLPAKSRTVRASCTDYCAECR